MRTNTLLLLIFALAALLFCLPVEEGRGQGKLPHGGNPAPVIHPAPGTPSIPHPVAIAKPPEVKPPVIKPNPTPFVKLPSNFHTEPIKVVKPPVTLPTIKEKEPIHHEQPGGVIAGSGKPPSHKMPGKEIVNKWTDLPKGGQQKFVAPGGKVKVSPDIKKKVVQALAKRPPKAGGKDWNQISVNNYKTHGVAIQNKFRPLQHNWFTGNWWQQHNVAHYPNWHYYHDFHHHPYGYWWRPATWPVFVGWYAAGWGDPFYYDYGTNVIYQNNLVYVNDVPVASATEYAEQAYALADVPPLSDQPIDWMPLGTFALAASLDDTDPNLVWQLAVSKDGLISGTALNHVTNQATPLQGRVDPGTQRIAIKAVDSDAYVLETGIYNLTQPQTPVLMHFGLADTQTWFLVRLDAPPAGPGPDLPGPGE